MTEQKHCDMDPRHGAPELRISTCLCLLPPRNGLELYTQVTYEHNSPEFMGEIAQGQRAPVTLACKAPNSGCEEMHHKSGS